MLHEEQLIQQLFKKMETLLFDFAVLGGYPRDIHFGRTPKDLDICVYNVNPKDIAESKFIEMLYGWLVSKGCGIKVHIEHNPNGSASGDDYVEAVWSTSLGVDIIFWNVETKWEVLKNFDFNINQFELDTKTGEVTRRLLVPGQETELVALRDLFATRKNPEERILHVMQIAKEVGWDTCLVKNNLISQMKKM